jgi:putative flippase GtrA
MALQKSITLSASTLLIKKAERTKIQLFRYVIVGGIAAVIDTGVFMLFSSGVGMHYIAAQTAGFIAGITANYLLSTLWIFERSRGRTSEISLFLATGVIGLLLSYALLWLLIDILSFTLFGNLAAKIATVGIVFIWNFGSRKLFVFKKDSL